jgi:Kae1-associated kinase Bud32
MKEESFDKNEFLKKGAEAQLVLEQAQDGFVLSKKRIMKNYRNPKLDLKIRTTRTRSEAKILKELWNSMNVPKLIKVDEKKAEILMEFIQGKRLKEVIEKNPALCTQAGKQIKKLHNLGIIHGDLTTSNIIFVDPKDKEIKKNKDLLERIKKKGSLFFIDFGLGFYSKKEEDRATDLVVFKKTFNATHSKIKNGWTLVLKGYAPSKELTERMSAIEKRARYH